MATAKKTNPPKSPTGMYAFWKYDIFPFLLWGPVKKFIDGGYAHIESYGNGSAFKYKFLLPDKEAIVLIKKLNDVKARYEQQSKESFNTNLGVVNTLLSNYGQTITNAQPRT